MVRVCAGLATPSVKTTISVSDTVSVFYVCNLTPIPTTTTTTTESDTTTARETPEDTQTWKRTKSSIVIMTDTLTCTESWISTVLAPTTEVSVSTAFGSQAEAGGSTDWTMVVSTSTWYPPTITVTDSLELATSTEYQTITSTVRKAITQLSKTKSFNLVVCHPRQQQWRYSPSCPPQHGSLSSRSPPS